MSELAIYHHLTQPPIRRSLRNCPNRRALCAQSPPQIIERRIIVNKVSFRSLCDFPEFDLQTRQSLTKEFSRTCRLLSLMLLLRKAIPLAFALLLLADGVICAQQYSFRSFAVADGLNNLAIRRIYQDRVGFIWVSTENGIFRYDGDRFEAFGAEQGIPLNSGVAFGDAPDGSLLAGGSIGLYRLSGNRFEKVPVDFNSIAWAQGIQSDGKGHTFLGTDAGLVELYSQPGHDQFAMRRFPQPGGTTGPGAYGVLVDGDILWYGCGRQLCRMDGRGTRVFGQEMGLPDREMQGIQKDRAGNLWVRARNAGIFEWAAGKARFERPKLPFPPEDIGGVPAVDSDGRILLTSPVGLLIGDNKGWQKVDRSVGLRGTVYAAFEDRQHSLWIGLAGRGLAKWLGYREWESYSTESGLASDLVYEILPREDGSLLVGTEAGLFRGERRPFGISFKGVAGLDGFAVHSVRRSPNGDIWIGTESRGAARIDARTSKVQWFGERQGLLGKAAYTLRFDRENRLWAATEAGLFMAYPPYDKFSRITELPATRIWAIAEGSDGTVWAGGVGGLYEFTAGRWKNLTRVDGLSNTEVLSLGAGPNGAIWVGYRFGGGIDRVNPGAGSVRIEKGIQRSGSNGLVYFLDFDRMGRLWAGTERGVDIWDGARWSHYDVNDGLAWDDCNLNAFAEEPDGTVWIGTSGGLSRFRPLRRHISDAPLAVVFTGITNGQKDVSGLHDPSFGSRANSIIARYSALNASSQNEVIFRYRLGGASSNWTETIQRELQFANLAPGAYQLEVDARISDGEWSRQAAEFPFRILPPWYFTWWFITLCVVVPLSLAAGVLILRFLDAQKRESELRQEVAKTTVDLQRANEELKLLSSTDPLTGLANKRVFNQVLDWECARVQRMNSVASLLMIDADHFKALNDTEGHLKGDEYLVALSAELTKLCRRRLDMAARYGGEEFAMILPLTNSADAQRIAESVRQAIIGLNLPHHASPVAPHFTVSVGVATATRECWCSREALLNAADKALYEAKNGGRNRVCVARQEMAVEKDTGPSTFDPH
jgi:diguanylate cyclase (GGDEF)-like protein